MKALKNQIKSNELNQNLTVEDMIILIQYLAKLSYKDRVDFFKTQNGPIYLFSTWKAIYTASKDLRSMCFGLFVANFLPVLTDKQFFSLSINYVNKVSKIHQRSDQQKLPQNFGIVNSIKKCHLNVCLLTTCFKFVHVKAKLKL